jgi:hypothetical protein
MMMNEWLEMTKKACTPTQFEAVNSVYMWHPSTPEGHDAARAYVLKLWKQFGYGIFFDMAPTAEACVKLIDDMGHIQAQKNAVNARYTDALNRITATRNAELEDCNNMMATAQAALDKLKGRYAND